MAKKSMVARDKKRAKLAAEYKDKREALIKVIKDPEASQQDKYDAYRKLSRMPRNASPVRYHNRCRVTGRPRGYIRRFQMSRIALRDLGLRGEIPGVTKSSW
jgi:small subunit ribosomal protein S14